MADQSEEAEDRQTLAAACRGDRDAQGRLLRALQDVWYRVCLGLLRDSEAARDATQETALRFLGQLPGFRGESRVRTWSIGIAINVAREMKRRTSRMRLTYGGLDPAADAPSQDSAPPADAEVAETRERLHGLLADLPDRQREAIVLRFFEAMSVEDTAAVMGCAAGTVKATVHQALRSLRKRLRHLVL